MLNKTLQRIHRRKPQYFEGLEIGAVSVKWVRRTQDGEILSEVVRHEGSPEEKIKRSMVQINGLKVTWFQATE